MLKSLRHPILMQMTTAASVLLGSGCQQDIDTLTITLADLGLAPGAAAESILAAILWRAASVWSLSLVDDRNDALVDDAGRSLDLDVEDLDIAITIRRRTIWRRGYLTEYIYIDMAEQLDAAT